MKAKPPAPIDSPELVKCAPFLCRCGTELGWFVLCFACRRIYIGVSEQAERMVKQARAYRRKVEAKKRCGKKH